jgi:hypothetical protein
VGGLLAVLFLQMGGLSMKECPVCKLEWSPIERSTGIRKEKLEKMRPSQLQEAEERLVIQVARALFEEGLVKFRYRETSDELVITAVVNAFKDPWKE